MSLCSDKGLQTDYVTIVTYCADKLFWHSFWRLRIGFWTLTKKKNSVLLLNVFSCVLSWMENWSFQIFHKFIPLQWNPWSHVTWVVSFINIIYGVIEPNRIVVKDTNKEIFIDIRGIHLRGRYKGRVSSSLISDPNIPTIGDGSGEAKLS